ncbi:hypothetical protein [Streptomyces niveus]|uniref:hypothetical protein n=1 Tax=Streptomyces niveus TaxID=193462 RepID=UPI00343086B0
MSQSKTSLTSLTPDFEAIRKDAEQEVERELADKTGAARRATACRIADEATASMDTARRERDTAALSLALFDNKLGAHNVAGIPGSTFTRMKKRALGRSSALPAASSLSASARRAGVERVPFKEALEMLPRAAREYAAAAARLSVVNTELQAEAEEPYKRRQAPQPRIPFDKTKKEAAEEVRRQLLDVTDHEARLRLAADIVTRADRERRDLEPRRNLLATSITVFDHMSGVHKLMGLSHASADNIRQAVLGVTRSMRDLTPQELRDAARRAGVAPEPNASTELQEVSHQMIAAKARRDTALPVVGDTTLALNSPPYDWPVSRMAEMIDWHPEHLRTKVNDAKKRAAERARKR